MFHFGIFLEVLTVLIGFLYVKKFKNTVYMYFLYYLLYTALNEITALYLFNNTFHISNQVLYNIYNPITVLFYLYFYKAFIKGKRTKKLINYFQLTLISSYIIEFLFFKLDFLSQEATYSNNFGSLLLLIVIILFLFEIINDEKIVFNLYKSMIFWMSIGLLLFVVGTIPIFISVDLMNFNNTYLFILYGLNIIMYGSFIIGFIVSKKKYNYLKAYSNE